MDDLKPADRIEYREEPHTDIAGGENGGYYVQAFFQALMDGFLCLVFHFLLTGESFGSDRCFLGGTSAANAENRFAGLYMIPESDVQIGLTGHKDIGP